MEIEGWKKADIEDEKTIRIDDMDVDLETDIDEVIKKYINKPSKD